MLGSFINAAAYILYYLLHPLVNRVEDSLKISTAKFYM